MKGDDLMTEQGYGRFSKTVRIVIATKHNRVQVSFYRLESGRRNIFIYTYKEISEVTKKIVAVAVELHRNHGKKK